MECNKSITSQLLTLVVDLSPLQSRLEWTSYEDENLKAIVQSQDLRNWAKAAEALNGNIHEGLCIRSPKQCRKRYLKHLALPLSSGNRVKWQLRPLLKRVGIGFPLGKKQLLSLIELKGIEINEAQDADYSLGEAENIVHHQTLKKD